MSFQSTQNLDQKLEASKVAVECNLKLAQTSAYNLVESEAVIFMVKDGVVTYLGQLAGKCKN